MGDLDERNYEQLLLETDTNPFKREVPVKVQLSPDVQLSGRVDFISYDIDTCKPVKVHEKKSVISKKTRTELRKGNYKVENLAQLVLYMSILEVSKGVLRYDYYEDNEGSIEIAETHVFNVDLKQDGTIYINKELEKDGRNAKQVVEHAVKSANIVSNGLVGDRPHNADVKYGSPCRFCKFSNTCDKFDIGLIKEGDFIEEATKEHELKIKLDERQPEIPKKPKRKMKRKDNYGL